MPELLRPLLEDVDERRADDLALLFGVRDAGEPVEKQVGRVHELERQLEPLEPRADLLRLVRAAAGRCPRRCRSAGRRSPCAPAARPPWNPRRPKDRRPRGRRRRRRESARRSRRRTTPSSSRPGSRRSRTRSYGGSARRARCARPPDGRAGRRAGGWRPAIAATGAFADVAMTSKPAGAAATKSPWLAHTLSDAGTSSNSGAPSIRLTTAWPYSRLRRVRDAAAERVGHELHAVADAERRRAEREHGRDRVSARRARTRSAVLPTG